MDKNSDKYAASVYCGRKAIIFPRAMYERGHRDVPEVDTQRVPCAETEYPSRVLEGLADVISVICLGRAPCQKRSMPQPRLGRGGEGRSEG
jgi:hypothetical protein